MKIFFILLSSFLFAGCISTPPIEGRITEVRMEQLFKEDGNGFYSPIYPVAIGDMNIGIGTSMFFDGAYVYGVKLSYYLDKKIPVKNVNNVMVFQQYYVYSDKGLIETVYLD